VGDEAHIIAYMSSAGLYSPVELDSPNQSTLFLYFDDLLGY